MKKTLIALAVLGLAYTGAAYTTGGIVTKLREALATARLGVEVRIAGAGTPHAAAALQSGPLPPDWVGTVVLRAP